VRPARPAGGEKIYLFFLDDFFLEVFLAFFFFIFSFEMIYKFDLLIMTTLLS